jgi:hypothetical protein
MPIKESPPDGVGGAMVESRPTQIVLLGNVLHACQNAAILASAE